MTMVRWDSFTNAQQAQISRMLEGFYARHQEQEDLTRGAWVPAVDIYSNGQHELVLKAELPDMKEQEIGLTVEDNTLTLRGERSSTLKSRRINSIASSATMARSREHSRCLRRSTPARSGQSTRLAC